MNDMIQTFAVYALPIVFAITLHEAAHAYVAKYFGDNTAYALGRMTLNPIRHIDPIGTLLLPIVLFFAGSPFLFGYAKPVPVEFGNLRRPKQHMAWVAAAGPAANIFMAMLWMLMAIGLQATGTNEEFLRRMAEAGVLTNLVIFAFNLIPVPPLDGGRIVTSFLPHGLSYKFSQIEPYGFFILIALLFLGVLHYWMRPVMYAAGVVVQVLLLPLTFFLS
jgi:Zn-dependent protease